MLGLIVWACLLVFIGYCLMPWWLFTIILIGCIVSPFLEK